MAATTKTELSATQHADAVQAAMQLLRAPKASGTLTQRFADGVADSGGGGAVIIAGFSAMTDNVGIAYAAARERQLRRSAERLVALAEAQS